MEGNDQVLKFKKLSKNASNPSKPYIRSAGFDLSSAYDYQIVPGGKCLILTDIQIAIPDGCYGRIAPRSGLALKHFIHVLAGVVDADFRGNVGVLLCNFGTETFKVFKGSKVAQLICERICTPILEEVDNLEETIRGERGFGSSDIIEHNYAYPI